MDDHLKDALIYLVMAGVIVTKYPVFVAGIVLISLVSGYAVRAPAMGVWILFLLYTMSYQLTLKMPSTESSIVLLRQALPLYVVLPFSIAALFQKPRRLIDEK